MSKSEDGFRKYRETVYGKGAEEWAHKIAEDAYTDLHPWITTEVRPHDGGWAVFVKEH